MNHPAVPDDLRLLQGKYALVTGSSRGIGRVIAETFAGRGCHVAVTARNVEAVRAVASHIESNFGVRSLAAACDVSRSESVHELFQQLREWSSGCLDFLVCNAGYPFLLDIWETPLHAARIGELETWFEGTLRTDLLGSVFCTAEALPLMMKQKGGSIVYISSTPAIEGYKGVPYTVAKAGVLGLMRDVAREYGQYNVRANALALGNILTPATFEALDSGSRTALAREAPLRRWGEPEEAANAALFLVSSLSSFITGQTIVVDGGTVRR
jgi:3-oxoacyl-[acyl-carrier protein] reductase